jgi:hypothetical protein
VRIRVEHDDLVTHGSGGRNKHSSELPTAEHTKRATGKNGHLFGGRQSHVENGITLTAAKIIEFLCQRGIVVS